MAEHLRAVALLVTTAWRVDRWRTAAAVLEPLGNVLALLAGLWLAVLTTGVVQQDTSSVVVGVVGLVAGVVLGWQLDLAGSQWRLVLSEKVAHAFDVEIATICATLPGLDHHENPEYRDKLELLRQGQGMLGRSLNALAMAVKSVCGALTVLVLLVGVHPGMVALVLLALPAVLTGGIQQRWHRRAEEESAEPGRLAAHLRSLAYDRDAGMEIRVFGLADEIGRRCGRAWSDHRRPLHRAERRAGLLAAARDLGYAAGVVAAVAFVLWRVLGGHAPAGDVVLVIYLSQQVQTALLWPVLSISGLGQTLRTAGRVRWLRDYAAAAAVRSGGLPAPERLTGGIVFDDVSFRYPGSDSWVLRHVSLTIPAGSVLALVGENGAGKTTVVKLLAGMYRPTEGRILVDGVDLADLDPTSWRRRLSAAFQDFARFEFTAGRTVGVGDLPHLDDDREVARAVDRAGATDLVRALPRGAATQLGASWDGVDLSTGQWQKLALGRALMRAEPLVLFLDEPTASLDAATEHGLFERYAAATSAGAARGLVTVLVSHRFSTVRAADQIVVLGDQRVLECGGHDELMAAGDHYAAMYATQADSYQPAPRP
ncbi:ABC transporter ATP-binding protein [Actinophytocola gossypii]|uniref:ABC transporter ATP-binding protein n=1 Tax=Actinophytocola gossypii TaxID=2812003 RepID=A0ABT2JGP8_9PSEU|nr:ABC transporter ATP-binding protein [Actinophytocola gossypii]MCT2587057.1 ABC transporter ATP-binding protein [Actinophytocola gossypii]